MPVQIFSVRAISLLKKLTMQSLPVLMIKGLGSSPFSKGLADSKGMRLDVLRTSSRTIAMDEISYAQRARQGVPMSFGHLQSGGLFWQEGFCRDFP